MTDNTHGNQIDIEALINEAANEGPSPLEGQTHAVEQAAPVTVQTGFGAAQVEQPIASSDETHISSLLPAAREAFIANAPSEIEKAQAEDGAGEGPGAGHNNDPDKMRKEFYRDVKTLGGQSGVGAAARPRLALRVVRAASDGILSLEKPKDGGKDDAAIIYETYQAEDSKKAEHSAGGAKANASKVRQLIGLGCCPNADGLSVAENAIRLHKAMLEQELKPQPLFDALVSVARAQCESDTELDDDGIMAAMGKKPVEKTLAKEWEAINKKIESLVTGENAAGLKDQTAEAIQIQELVAAKVAGFTRADNNAAFIKQAMERGMSYEAAAALCK